jgi:hypothetical protein
VPNPNLTIRNFLYRSTAAAAEGAGEAGVSEAEGAAYMREMPAMCYTDVEAFSGYNHNFVQMAESPQGNTKKKMRRLLSEVRWCATRKRLGHA